MANTKLTDALNELLGGGWSAYAQHHTHVGLLRSWGIEGLATDMEAAIADEPVSLTNILNRILDLDATPAFTTSPPNIGTDLQSILENDLEVQRNVQDPLRAVAELANTGHDTTTRTLIETIIADEEQHLYWIETELQLLDRLGEGLYTANRINAPGTTPA